MTALQQTIPAKYLTRKDEIAAQFIDMAERHISDLVNGKATRRYTATDFGDQLFIHPRHLTNTLRSAINTSVCDYMENRLLEEIKIMLAGTNLSIAEVGMRFAYDDASNFTKFFKLMTGITPKAYRQQVLEKS